MNKLYKLYGHVSNCMKFQSCFFFFFQKWHPWFSAEKWFDYTNWKENIMVNAQIVGDIFT